MFFAFVDSAMESVLVLGKSLHFWSSLLFRSERGPGIALQAMQEKNKLQMVVSRSQAVASTYVGARDYPAS